MPPSYRSAPPASQSNYPERKQPASPVLTGCSAGAGPSRLPRRAGAARK
jgi:hypothetical protein